MSTLPASPRIQFRAALLLPALSARTDPPLSEARLTDTAQRDLGRYYETLRRSLPDLTPGQWSLIFDALNGIMTEPHSVPLLWANVADSLDDGLAAKWDVDGPALVATLRALSYAGALAVADLAEQFWAATPRGLSIAAFLSEQKLVTTDAPA